MLRPPAHELGWFGWVELGVLWVMFVVGCVSTARAVRGVVARRRQVERVRFIEHVGTVRAHPTTAPRSGL